MKTLLLHTCCAPCVTACLDVLRGEEPWQRVLNQEPSFDKFIVYFYNPNVHPEAEYRLRAAEARRYAEMAGAVYIEGAYEPPLWHQKTAGLENEPEKGARCSVCYGMRLGEAFAFAQREGCAAVATTLTLSPYKNTAEINKIGLRLQQETGVPYLESDFKKQGGFIRSKAMSQKNCIYCQSHCGCPSSLRDKLLRTRG